MGDRVDLARVRKALARLDELAEMHPDLVDRSRPATQEDVDAWIQDLKGALPMANTQQIAVRLPTDLIERIDAYTERVKAEIPGMNITRADAIRALILKGLADVERKSEDVDKEQ